MSTIQEARQSLPVEYGYKIVDENGRRVLLVRTPRPKPDYLHELAEVALYVSLDEIKDLKDIVLIGTEKATRLEPRILRDHIRDQMSQDGEIASEMAKRLDRNYAYTIIRAPRAATHVALAIRIPRASVSQITPDDVKQIRQVLAPVFDGRIKDCQLAFIIADQNFERLGRRVFVDLVAPDLAPAVAPAAPAVTIELPGRAVQAAPAPVPTPSIAARLGAAPAAPPHPVASDVIVAPSTPQGVGAAWTPGSVPPPVAPPPKPAMTSVSSDD
ncbi:MAG TPA: hypothetical protein VM889_05120, partial [Candidatus Thermoplasmatota archaeon]|nr:hypothetical protein [Candidatus Thermoplasmatota archaeon]